MNPQHATSNPFASGGHRDVVVPVLNHLIGICKDGEYGFRLAGEDVKAPACQNLFWTYAQQRTQFASELQALVRRFGLPAESDGSLVGGMHRRWLDLKAKVSSRRNMTSILEECARGEDAAEKAYEEALCEPLAFGPEVLAVIRRQYAAVKIARANIRSLRDMRRRG